jgi:hypothetical protein
MYTRGFAAVVPLSFIHKSQQDSIYFVPGMKISEFCGTKDSIHPRGDNPELLSHLGDMT